MKYLGVAIDGPAGAGKSTVAKGVAEALGIRYLDTGAMYRAMALYAWEQGVSVEDERGVAALLDRVELKVDWDERGQRVYLDGRDRTEELRSERVSRGASDISKLRCMRNGLASMQRELANHCSVVMDGRDIGTFVLPETPYKFFVTAADTERARRRVVQLEARGESADYESILRDLRDRDSQDTGREYVPLRQAEDAILVDTTHMSIAQAVSFVVSAINSRGE